MKLLGHSSESRLLKSQVYILLLGCSKNGKWPTLQLKKHASISKELVQLHHLPHQIHVNNGKRWRRIRPNYSRRPQTKVFVLKPKCMLFYAWSHLLCCHGSWTKLSLRTFNSFGSVGNEVQVQSCQNGSSWLLWTGKMFLRRTIPSKSNLRIGYHQTDVYQWWYCKSVKYLVSS